MARKVCLDTPEEKSNIIRYLRDGNYPSGLNKEQKRTFRRKCQNFSLINDMLCFVKADGTRLPVVFSYETDKILLILDQEHRECHYGINKMVDIIGKKYYNIPSAAIREYVNRCASCRNYTPMRTLQEIELVPIRAKRDRYVIDCVDMRAFQADNDGFAWILNVIDSYSKFLWSFKLKNKSAIAVVECLEQCFMDYGVPAAIQADNGKEFANKELKALCERMNVTIIHGRPRHPQSQGMVERVNQTVKRWLGKKLHGVVRKRWIDHHRKVVYGYNVSVHRATNRAPFLLFHGTNGFNSVNLQREINELGEQTSINEEEVSTETQYPVWNLDDQNSEPFIVDEMDAEVLENEDVVTEIHDSVMRHFNSYSKKVANDANSNFQRRLFDEGDVVMIAKDFDNNQRTRRRPFDSFYEDGLFTVVQLLDNNRIKVENIDDPEDIRYVSKGQIKKLNDI
ncbi:hypothetical protein ENBRE01_0316 [Enteropsectra breve]|nr:hypothetical protein ENBRE01_0316 [Enteropsectra breve]